MKSFERAYFIIAGVILLITGAAKLLSLFGSAEILDTYEPIFQIRFRSLFVVVGVVEVGVGVFSILVRESVARAVVLLSLSSAFAIYRLGLLWLGYQLPCKCLGMFTDYLKLDQVTANKILQGMMFVILFGSIIVLVNRVLSRKESSG